MSEGGAVAVSKVSWRLERKMQLAEISTKIGDGSVSCQHLLNFDHEIYGNYLQIAPPCLRVLFIY